MGEWELGLAHASEHHRLFELRTTTDLSLRAIAAELRRDASTLSREYRRNRNPAGQYFPEPAQAMMVERHSQAKLKFGHVSKVCITEIKQRLKQYHSPEQIVFLEANEL
jgi:transposase, IS30 family